MFHHHRRLGLIEQYAAVCRGVEPLQVRFHAPAAVDLERLCHVLAKRVREQSFAQSAGPVEHQELPAKHGMAELRKELLVHRGQPTSFLNEEFRVLVRLSFQGSELPMPLRFLLVLQVLQIILHVPFALDVL